jgi:DNA-binding PadR family transcriptional regulator
VIALLLEGVSTPYELQSLAGLSPGATIPILQSLVEDGCVRAGKPGTRGRVAYVVTRKGTKWLEAVWPTLLKRKTEEGRSGVWLADQYIGLRAQTTAAILKAEVKVIDAVLEGLGRGLTAGKPLPSSLSKSQKNWFDSSWSILALTCSILASVTGHP